jgi:hypothetical protein
MQGLARPVAAPRLPLAEDGAMSALGAGDGGSGPGRPATDH